MISNIKGSNLKSRHSIRKDGYCEQRKRMPKKYQKSAKDQKHSNIHEECPDGLISRWGITEKRTAELENMLIKFSKIENQPK